MTEKDKLRSEIDELKHEIENIDELRIEIESIDNEMRSLFESRMRVAKKIGLYKKEKGIPVKDEKREEFLIKKNLSGLSDVSLKEFYAEFQKCVIGLSCEYQEKVIKGEGTGK